MNEGITIGMDLGDRRTEICVLDGEGQIVERQKVATSMAGIERALAPWRDCRVVLEVGTHSPWVSRVVAACGHQAVVANPRRVRLISHTHDKSDSIDAELLARLGRVDPKLLWPIRHRSEQAQKDLLLLRVRDSLVRMRVAAIHEARGHAKSLGLRLPRCATYLFARRMAKEGLTEAFPGMAALCTQVDLLSRQIQDIDEQIEQLCQTRYPETELLTQVAGVGALTALAFVLTLEDPGRFRRSRSVAGYVGLRPRRRQSGDKDPHLGITKAGDPYLRRLLVQAAHHLLGRYGPDCDLRRYGLRLEARGGRGAKKKAIVAVARKLAVLLHHLWSQGLVYEPRHHSGLEAA